MKTFFFVYLFISFFIIIVQIFIINTLARKQSFVLHSKLFNFNSYTYLLYKPFRFKFYHKYFKLDYINTLFFFSNFDSDKFFFHVDDKFSLRSFFINDYNFPVPISTFRSNFVNYSLANVNICKRYIFSEKDFTDLHFSEDFSFIFGSFSLVHYSYIADTPFNYIYKYFFVFSLSDFSITVYIVFLENDSYNVVIPVAFFKLSIKDYRYLTDTFDFTNFEKKLCDISYVKSIFTSFLRLVFSNFLIPSRDYVSFGSKRYPHLFIKNMIYSNIDSRPFKTQDTPIDYFTFTSSVKNSTSDLNVHKVRAFSFFRYKLKLILLQFLLRKGVAEW